MNTKDKLGKKTLLDILKVSSSNLLFLISGILVGFLLPKIIGKIDYGYYKTFTLYAGYVGLLHFGFSDGIYLIYGGKKFEELNKSKFRSIFIFLFILEALILFFGIVLAVVFLTGDMRFVFICIFGYMFSANLTNYFQIISQITGRFNELSLRTVFQSLLTIVSIFVLWILNKFFSFKIEYKIYIIIFLTINYILTFWYIFTYKELIIGEKESNSFKYYLSFIKIGFPLLISNLCSSLILNLDRQFVNLLFDVETYAVYAFAYNMLSLITTAMSAVATVLYPSLKRVDENGLQLIYDKLMKIILTLVFLLIIVYFPLCWFVNWFLPSYSESLVIFRIILPGLAVSSPVTIIMHNYYKSSNNEVLYFLKSMCILIISIIANLIAYLIFKTTISISISSIFVMFIWYLIIERYFIKKYNVEWIRNYLYIVVMTALFYLITMLSIWWMAMLIYLLAFIVVSLFFYRDDAKYVYNKIKDMRKKI